MINEAREVYLSDRESRDGKLNLVMMSVFQASTVAIATVSLAQHTGLSCSSASSSYSSEKTLCFSTFVQPLWQCNVMASTSDCNCT